jgi:CheY-like chemotaxis protein
MVNKVRILIVEDEIITSIMISENLKLNGFIICDIAATGEDAVKKATQEHPDVILMDIRLAGKIDGIEAAQQILMKKFVPILFMTGYSNEDFIKRTAELNSCGYINKPVIIAKVIEIINSIYK